MNADKQYSLQTLLGTLGVMSIWLAMMRVHLSAAWIVAVVGATIGATLVFRRIFRIQPVRAALFAWLVGTFTGSCHGFVHLCLVAFSPPSNGGGWKWGGGWPMVILGTVIATALATVLALAISSAYIAGRALSTRFREVW